MIGLDTTAIIDFYKNNKIVEPEERAKSLGELMDLTAVDHEIIMKKAHDEGRASALNELEKWLVGFHKEGEVSLEVQNASK